MRVIAGKAKGRQLRATTGNNTRPTTDKVKESLFSILSPFLKGGMVLDLFAGTGGLGIEALSRGMDQAIFIDRNKESISVIKENVEACHFQEQVEIYRNEAERALKALLKREIAFDLVLLDPPYKKDVLEKIITFLSDNQMVNEEGIIVAEHDAKVRLPEAIGTYTAIKHANYGNIGVTIYQY